MQKALQQPFFFFDLLVGNFGMDWQKFLPCLPSTVDVDTCDQYRLFNVLQERVPALN